MTSEQFQKIDQTYLITQDGQVINRQTLRVIKQRLMPSGYLSVQILGKYYFVHRLVGLKHVPNPDLKPDINHWDENKTNNVYQNLVWATKKENMQHSRKRIQENTPKGKNHYKSRLTEEDVLWIRSNPLALSQRQLATRFGVQTTTIGAISSKRNWKHI